MKHPLSKISRKTTRVALLLFFLGFFHYQFSTAQVMYAGTGKSNITADTCLVNDSLFVKALVLKNSQSKIAIITLDVISIGGIGDIKDSFLPSIKSHLKNGFNIDNVLVCASHNHLDGFLNGGGKIAKDVGVKTLSAVRKALMNMERVKVGSGKGFEDRFAINRRVRLKDGKVFTIRHANPNTPDNQIAGIGEIDPEIGILKIGRLDGTTKAVLYNYACHPYTGVPSKAVTADFPGFASQLIEEQLGHGSMAFFLQGAAGDISEILYKDVNQPRDSAPFGQMLGLSTLKVLKDIIPSPTTQFSIVTDTLNLPLRSDIPKQLEILEAEEKLALGSLRSTSLNMKTFIPLYIKYGLNPEYPSYYAYQYLFEEKEDMKGLKKMDETNRRDLDKYVQNILSMEKLAQIQEDREMLKLRQKEITDRGGKSLSIEVLGLRIGNFILVTFPGEAFARVGLDIKNSSPHENTFMACYTNGYIHYGPTAESYEEGGYEVMNCILAPEWQKIYEKKIISLIKKL